MKIKVISKFYDKFHTSTLFTEGMVLDFDEKRASDIIARKLGVPFVEPKNEEQKPEPKKEEEVVEPPKEEKVIEPIQEEKSAEANQEVKAEEEVKQPRRGRPAKSDEKK